MLENIKFEKREINGEEIWKKNGIWKNKSEKNGVVKVVDMEMEKIGEKEGLKVRNKGRYGVKVKKGSKKRRNLVEFSEKRECLKWSGYEGFRESVCRVWGKSEKNRIKQGFETLDCKRKAHHRPWW